MVRVLLSGGVDSAACVQYYLNSGYQVAGFFVDYGQSSSDQEKNAAKKISEHYNIDLQSVAWTGQTKSKPGFILGRNAFLLLGALLEGDPMSSGLIAIGVHAGTEYLDCRPGFISKLRDLFELYSGGVIQLDAPFLDWQKTQILSYCREQSVPLHLTYSCELGEALPCGECQSCQDIQEVNLK